MRQTQQRGQDARVRPREAPAPVPHGIPLFLVRCIEIRRRQGPGVDACDDLPAFWLLTPHPPSSALAMGRVGGSDQRLRPETSPFLKLTSLDSNDQFPCTRHGRTSDVLVQPNPILSVDKFKALNRMLTSCWQHYCTLKILRCSSKRAP